MGYFSLQAELVRAVSARVWPLLQRHLPDINKLFLRDFVSVRVWPFVTTPSHKRTCARIKSAGNNLLAHNPHHEMLLQKEMIMKDDVTNPEEESRKRLQLDFSSEAYNRLQELKEVSKARSNAEVVRNALRLYEWFLEQKRNEFKLQVTNGNVVKEVELVF